MKLHYNISGKGEPIVFIHGAFVNSNIWQHQTEYFQDYYQIITVDLRGHGLSDTSDLSEYSVSVFGEDILHLLDNLHIEKATVCGLSLGAMVAQYLGANYPSRVSSLLLVGATASLRLSALEKIVTSVFFPKWMAMWLFSRLNTDQFMRVSFFLTWFMLGSKWLGNKATRQKIKDAIGQVKRKELKKIYAAVHGFRKQDMSKGDYPVLLLNGSHDSPVVRRHCKYIENKLKRRCTTGTIDNAGHACNHDQPFIFNQAMRTWLIQHGIMPMVIETSGNGVAKVRPLHQTA